LQSSSKSFVLLQTTVHYFRAYLPFTLFVFSPTTPEYLGGTNMHAFLPRRIPT
jgi:hypothetical protein